MKITLKLIIDDDNQKIAEDVACFSKDELSAETLGLTLNESKTINAEIQKRMVDHQIKNFAAQHRFCACCGAMLSIKGYNQLIYRMLFGKLHLKSPRFESCKCHSQIQSSFSPLPPTLTKRISSELSYLEAKWASLVSYGLTVKILEEVLPLDIHPSSLFDNMQKVSTRLESELQEEQPVFIEGMPTGLG